MLLAQASSTTLDPALLPKSPAEALYVHIPFCFHKCHYCDFYSITRQTPERMDRFVDLILREADRWSKSVSLRSRTVFFGGGTPTLLPLENMQRLIAGLRDTFDFSQCDEWTVEANPATVSAEYCQMLKSSGVNRMSFGAQSFNPSELSILERHHAPDDVPRSLALARDAGFKRLNVDLIYAIPGQTLQSWMKSLEQAIALNTDHISCYGLTYEPNTPMAVRRRMGQFTSTESELEIAMMLATRQRLSDADLEAYEISNYASPGQECRHNLIYWRGENYLGLGPSAASHLSGWRWRNPPHLGEWERGAQSDLSVAVDVENLKPQQRAGELAMLLLRLKTGLEFGMFSERSGYDARAMFSGPIDRFTRQGLLQADERGLRLTDAGLSVADGIAADFLAAAESFTS